MPFMQFKLNLIEQGRAAEWLTSTVLVGFGIALIWPGDTLSGPGYAAFRTAKVSEMFLWLPTLTIGLARIFALMRNGHMKRSPLLRLIGAIFGTAVFTMLALGFLGPTVLYGNPVSTGVPAYFVMALYDLLAAWRSGADVRMAVKHSPS